MFKITQLYDYITNQAVTNPVCHPAAGTHLGEFPPWLLQRPPNGPADMRGETTTDDPERSGASGVQPTEEVSGYSVTFIYKPFITDYFNYCCTYYFCNLHMIYISAELYWLQVIFYF